MNQQVDASDTKVVSKSNKGSSTKTIEEEKREDSKKEEDEDDYDKNRLASLDDDLYPNIMDSNRPREEWNISHVYTNEANQPTATAPRASQ